MIKTGAHSKTATSKKGGMDLKAIVIILLLVIIAVILFIFLKGGGKTEMAGSGGIGLTIDKSAGEFVAQEQESVSKPGVAIPGWGTIKLAANTKEITTVDFFNPADNAGWYYLTFELMLLDEDGNSESIYKSGLVEPEKHIQRIELTRELEPGTYSAVVHVQPYTMDGSMTPTNNADMKVTLEVA